MTIAHINGCNVCMAWRVPAFAKHGVTEELYAHVDDPSHDEYSAAERPGDRVRAALRHRPPLDRRRVLRPHARAVERRRDPRAHHPDRRLARVRSPHRGARPRPGLRVGAAHRRLIGHPDQSGRSARRSGRGEDGAVEIRLAATAPPDDGATVKVAGVAGFVARANARVRTRRVVGRDGDDGRDANRPHRTNGSRFTTRTPRTVVPGSATMEHSARGRHAPSHRMNRADAFGRAVNVSCCPLTTARAQRRCTGRPRRGRPHEPAAHPGGRTAR